MYMYISVYTTICAMCVYLLRDTRVLWVLQKYARACFRPAPAIGTTWFVAPAVSAHVFYIHTNVCTRKYACSTTKGLAGRKGRLYIESVATQRTESCSELVPRGLQHARRRQWLMRSYRPVGLRSISVLLFRLQPPRFRIARKKFFYRFSVDVQDNVVRSRRLTDRSNADARRVW